MGSVKGLFLGPSNIMGSLPDCGGRANMAREAVGGALGASDLLSDDSVLVIGVGLSFGSGLSCAHAWDHTPVIRQLSRQLRRQNFLNMRF